MTRNGQPIASRGPHPTGLLYYDVTGHMAAQIMPDRVRPKYQGEPTPEEAKAALTGYTAYFGTYTVDESSRRVAHHSTGNLSASGLGIPVVRQYEFLSDDRLVLRPVENPDELIWERLH
jgi:hypothetical protein